MITLENIGLNLSGNAILQDINLNVNKGDVVALIGPSGAGKSSLLRCLNLLLMPQSGQIQFHEHQIHLSQLRLRPHSRKNQAYLSLLRTHISMVFQQFNLWAHKTVLENIITAPMVVLKKSKEDAVENAKFLLEKVGLAQYQNRYPSQLSGGQQQRAGIARALAMSPEVILFDEPTSALDPEMVKEVLSVIKDLTKENITMLIATHELGFVKEVANRLVYMEKGGIVSNGEAKQLFATPDCDNLKKFIASANLGESFNV